MIGIEKYRELHPDIVTMDITMPEMDGIGALRAIGKYDPNAKVIMVTAMGQEPMVLDAVVKNIETVGGSVSVIRH